MTQQKTWVDCLLHYDHISERVFKKSTALWLQLKQTKNCHILCIVPKRRVIHHFAEWENRLYWPPPVSLGIVVNIDQQLHVWKSSDDFENEMFNAATSTTLKMTTTCPYCIYNITQQKCIVSAQDQCQCFSQLHNFTNEYNLLTQTYSVSSKDAFEWSAFPIQGLGCANVQTETFSRALEKFWLDTTSDAWWTNWFGRMLSMTPRDLSRHWTWVSSVHVISVIFCIH